MNNTIKVVFIDGRVLRVHDVIDTEDVDSFIKIKKEKTNVIIQSTNILYFGMEEDLDDYMDKMLKKQGQKGEE